MCGVAGYFSPHGAPSANPKATLEAIAATLRHRGPDGCGTWHDDAWGIGLAHSRLSIQDLSDNGSQPMASSSGRYIVAYNGEIVNLEQLKTGLSTPLHNGRSDTAVLLSCIESWGIPHTLKKLTGMFAFACWDRQTHTLTLVRDPIGIKPLYYGWVQDTLWFGSELAITSAMPHFAANINASAVGLLTLRNAIGYHHCIYEGWSKLPPGHTLSISQGTSPKLHRYWDPVSVAQQSIANPFQGSYREACDQLEEQLSLSVQQHLISDVPIGTFLSGGIDSSLVCALAQHHSKDRLKTFSIGFHENEYNEAHHAKTIGQYLGTDHHECYLSSGEMVEAIPSILDHASEPFSDSSLICTALVSKMTRQHVTVALSGDGGDELFCGYPRFKWTQNIWRQLQRIPKPLKPLIRSGLLTVSPETWDQILGWSKASKLIGEHHLGHKLHRLAQMLHCHHFEDLYTGMVSHRPTANDWVPGAKPLTTLLDERPWTLMPTPKEQMMLADFLSYLPDDILTKVDRASMQFSLETRVPLLTPDLFAFAWSLPLQWREDKKILKDVLYRHIPKKLMDRPKMGFGIPLGSWLRGPLKPWAEHLLSSPSFTKEHRFNQTAIINTWKQHLSERCDHGYHLWDVLCFLHWRERTR